MATPSFDEVKQSLNEWDDLAREYDRLDALRLAEERQYNDAMLTHAKNPVLMSVLRWQWIQRERNLLGLMAENQDRRRAYFALWQTWIDD